MKHTHLYTGIAFALAQSFTAVSPAFAQLEEVIVTAERRVATLQETDISMTVFGADTLQEIGADAYYQVGDFAPNVKIHEMPGKMGAAINIRGFRNAETISTFDPKVTLYLDGVLLSKSTGSAFEIMDLERVEILRGPQGTLYGRNTVGGAINIITRKPNIEDFEGKLTVTVGDYDQLDVRGTLNVPLTDRLAIKGTLASLQRDGYFDDVQVNVADPDIDNGDMADRDTQAGHLQLQWYPMDGLSVYYAYDRAELDTTGWPLVITEADPAVAPQLVPWVQDGGSGNIPLDYRQFMKGDADGHNLTVEWNLSDDLQLVSITGLRSFKVDNSQDSEGSPVFVFHTISGDKADNFTQELRLVGTAMDSRLEYVVGAYYMDEDIKKWYTTNIFPYAPAPGYFSTSFGDAQTETWAIFGEATYALTDKLDVTFGLRYTEEDKQASRTDQTLIPAFGSDTTTPLPDAQDDFGDTTGTLSFAYQWTDDIMTYAKVSKGYASGGFSPRAPDPELFGIGFDDETVWNYELGWKTTWLDNHLLVNGAIFYADYQDLQVTVITAGGRGNITNASDAEIYGGEIEIQARPTANLDLGAGYGYLDPEYKDYIDQSGEDVSDVNEWPHAPKHSFNAYGRYVVPELLLGGDLVFRLDYNWQDDFSLLAAPNNFVDGYDRLDGRVSLNSIHGPGDTTFDVSLWGRNLTDELYYTSGYRVAAFGFRALAAAAPRTYGVDLTWAF